MTPERWRQIESVLQEALERGPAERAVFLERACAGDPSLREEVASLLMSAEPARSYLGAGALEDATALLDDDEADSLVGQSLGHYLVEARLGAGGMGEVYLARDLSLGRKVALKLLDPLLAGDARARARFLREAQLASVLDHPNICTVHEVGEAEGRPFIAMQYVEGETLRQVIGGRPLEPGRALSLSVQVAEALAAAHARGVIHRDIKPGNIIVTPEGRAKVLDFGIAKLLENGEGGTGADVTVTGQLVGTPSAMSPEQARGLAVDARTDVWSLGVVLYEMLTGRAPFQGETAGDVLALVLSGEPPPLSQLAPQAPEALRQVVGRALSKDPGERYQTVGEMLEDLRAVKREWDVRELIESSGADGGTSAHATPARAGEGGTLNAGATTGGATGARTASGAEYPAGASKRRRLITALVPAALLAALVVFGVVLYRSTRRAEEAPAPFQTTKLTRLTTAGTATAASVSPDGRHVAYAVGEAVRTGYFSRWPTGRSSLWVKQVSTGTAVEIVPAADVQYKGTTFSRDGEFVYYVAVDDENPMGALYRVSALGGTPRKVLADIDSPVDFSPDGRRLAFFRVMPSEGSDALVVADADGGNQRTLAARGGNDWFEADGAAWSPDGRVIVCAVGTDTGGTSMSLVEVPAEGGEPRPLTARRWRSIGRVAWLGDGRGLVLIASDNLTSTSWAGTETQVWHVAYPTGEARKITNDLNGYTHTSLAVTSDSRAVVTSQEDTSARIWTASLDGSAASDVKQVTNGKFDGRLGLSWTPDGRILYVTKTGEEEDVWVMNGDGAGQRQLTDDAALDETPVVPPDGRHIYFTSSRTGIQQVWRMDADGDNAFQLTEGSSISYDPTVSPDGKWVVYTSWRSGTQALWKMPAAGGEPVRLTDGPAGRAVFSPDGRFISCGYFEAESRRWRLAIIPSEGGPPARVFDLPVPGVNAVAGLHWTPDGRSLVYVETRGGVSNVWRMPLDGGRPVRLTDFDSGQIFTLALSPDGRRLALSRGTITSDVVLIRDLR